MVEQAYWYSHTRWSLYDPFPSFAPRESDHSQIAELAQSLARDAGLRSGRFTYCCVARHRPSNRKRVAR